MFKWLLGTSVDPRIQEFPRELQQWLHEGAPRQQAISNQRFDLFLQLINSSYRLQNYEDFSDMNAIRQNSRVEPLTYYCTISVNRPCFLAEILKRGGDPNQPYKVTRHNQQTLLDFEEVYYPVAQLISQCTQRCYFRMVLLHGANFNQRVDERNAYGKVTRTKIRAREITPGYYIPRLSRIEVNRQYGPVIPWLNPLPSQNPAIFRYDFSPSQYLELVEQEFIELQRLKAKGDTLYKQEQYYEAAQAYVVASDYMYRFAGDHEELLLFYLDKSLAYYHNAVVCYLKLAEIGLTDEICQQIQGNLRQKIEFINQALVPNRSVRPLVKTRDVLAPDPINVGSNPEELKTAYSSAVYQSIISQRHELEQVLASISQPAQLLDQMFERFGLRQRAGTVGSQNNSSPDTLSHDGDSNSSRHNSESRPLLPKEKDAC